MRQRCRDPNVSHFKNYGGRGIHVCERWNEFANFLADMGPRPPGSSVDRIDNNGDYTPENCRWSTPAEQNRNKRSNRVVLCDGEYLTISAAADRKGLLRDTVYMRIHRGWPEDKWLIPKCS